MKKAIEFIIKFISKTKDDDIIALSAQFSYYIILSIFPLLILGISIMCNYSSYIIYLLSTIEHILPSDIFNIVSDIVHNTIENYSKNKFSAGMLVALWSATAGSSTIIRGINKAYGFTPKSSFIFMRLEGIVFTLAIMIAMQLVFALIVLGKEIILFIQNIVKFPEITYLLIDILRLSLPIVLLFLIFSAAYKFLTYEKVSFSFVFPGAATSTAGFMIGSFIYSNYISTRAKYYNSIYGNLSIMIIFLIWIFILSIIFLTGAEVNYFAGRHRDKNNKAVD
jgi:membrane protein